jgi:ribosomal-protein-alanine N-acetyltransferase
MRSERLDYRVLTAPDLGAFHELLRDLHVRRYLFDGQLVSLDWCANWIETSQTLLATRGVGTWLVFERASASLLGFCGFASPVDEDELQLIYALTARFTGQGYATEMAGTAIRHAFAQAGVRAIAADVDEVNAASVRVLEKLGFRRAGSKPGCFGSLLLFKLIAEQANLLPP